ncbi:MAG TPA: hypothetical protein DCE71_01565 [Parachlamydiales bacterium]|nr:hypothetical protein [Parachlamydiales bacterium]
MTVELEGEFDEWAAFSDFFGRGGYVEKIATTWEGRKIEILSSSGREDDIFRAQQIQFVLLQRVLQKEDALEVLYGRIEYPLPFEEFFLDADEEIMLAKPWSGDPNQEFIFAPPYSLNQAHPCGLRKFWKKHKKAIIITAVVIVLVAGTVVAVTMLGSSAASAVAGAGGSALIDLVNNDPTSNHPSSPTPKHSSFEPPKDFRDKYIPPYTPPPPIDFSSQIPSLQPLPTEVPSYSPPNWFLESKMPSTPPQGCFPNYPPSFSKDVEKNTAPSLPDMTKFSDIKPPVPFTPSSFFESPPPIPISPQVSEIFSNLFNHPSQTAPEYSSLGTDRTHPLPNLTPSTSNRLAMEEALKGYPSDPYLSGWLGAPLEIVEDKFRIQKTHSFSEKLPTLGTPNPDLLFIAGNGMNTSKEEALGHQAYLRKLARDQLAVDFIYNHSNSAPIDILEIFCLNYFGYSPITADLLQRSWQKFADYHEDNPAKKVLQYCHSQEAIHVYNALKTSSQKLRDRIIVVAIAPAKVIPDELCYKSFNYASELDIVPLGEGLFASSLDCPHPDLEASELWKMALKHRKELVLLKPHPNAKGLDHEFQSPTFTDVQIKHMNDYFNKNGEYP